MARSKAEVAAIVDRFVKALQKTLPVERVILFGSYVKGTPQPESDIDVAVISPAFGRNPWEDRKLLYRTIIFENLEPSIEPHPFAPADLKAPSPLLLEILRTGQTIYPA
ncbi:MAG TPA: nucleotidyltransferase domain-containing protein [Firmicutes bacterium]|nr:nucleotidyltransferase domain-containing protein [Bacillota bacterium]